MDKIILKKQIEAIKKLGWKVELNRVDTLYDGQ